MSSVANAQEELVRLFLRNGCIRHPKPERLKEGHRNYKKGYEIRWTALNRDEEFTIIRMLSKLGFKHGKPFKKVNRIIIPVYGLDSLTEFQKILTRFSSNAKTKSKRKRNENNSKEK
jgi:hypothetical protein